MTCFICGAEKNLSKRAIFGRSICRECNKDTPVKVSRSYFDRVYWAGGDANTVPESTKREFYADYLASSNNLTEYKNSTTTQTE